MDDGILRFLKTLIEYFKPSNNMFSHQELQPGRSLPAYVIVGLDLIDWLLSSHSVNRIFQILIIVHCLTFMILLFYILVGKYAFIDRFLL